jgi:hypothetical protein
MARTAIRELDKAGDAACLMIDSEVALSAWILYGDLNRRISYNHVGAPEDAWRSAWPGDDCKMAILPLVQQKRGPEWRLVWTATPFGACARQ